MAINSEWNRSSKELLDESQAAEHAFLLCQMILDHYEQAAEHAFRVCQMILDHYERPINHPSMRPTLTQCADAAREALRMHRGSQSE